MKLRQGPVFSCAPGADVEEYLRGRKLERYELPPEKLHIGLAGQDVTLRFCSGVPREYPVRYSFLAKLLQWYSFPLAQMRRLSEETLVSIANDYLLNMRSAAIRVRIENGEALTLTGVHYNELTDLNVLRICGTPRVTVSRNDFLMRLYSEVRAETEPVPGDQCGFGFNVINSETGFRALEIHSFVLRYVCSNGAVMPSAPLRQSRRIHRNQDDGALERFLIRRTRAVMRGFTKVSSALAASAATDARRQRKTAEDRLRRIIGRTGASRLVNSLSAGASRYDLFNLITTEAKRHDIITRLQLETLAGKVLTGK